MNKEIDTASKIGFMQGRLSPIIDSKIQIFPKNFWREEYVKSDYVKIKKIEWTLDYETFNYNPILSKKGRAEIFSLNKEHSITVPSLTCDYLMQKPFWKMISSEVNQVKKNFLNIIDACIELNIKIIVVPLVDNGSIENKNEEINLIKYFDEIKNILTENNIKIAFESDYPPNKLGEFINKFDEKIGINFDMGNSASLGFDPENELDILAPKIMNVHVKDRKFKGGTVPLGEGNCDFNTVFSNLRKIQYDGNYILQTARSKNGKHVELISQYREKILKWINNE
tara:strand:- start:20 stop:868 length:849 start_codon:yes stop_codon:yes gene_type:complete